VLQQRFQEGRRGVRKRVSIYSVVFTQSVVFELLFLLLDVSAATLFLIAEGLNLRQTAIWHVLETLMKSVEEMIGLTYMVHHLLLLRK
jgi:hypothetical protein